ncbi:hypothetical protein AQULUS_14670 [Aquicella lusitana]|uniref:Calpain family cysteine protease n=1 Tax=Aquicella lusitana TaxID=254246 RepID=A0A370GDP8_9COXI|nr:calpain family cysteine protease [Aquicella lusitana]VVC73719.1 hypothetical protein AQULUS_14670 [Aquicella lusitana]
MQSNRFQNTLFSSAPETAQNPEKRLDAEGFSKKASEEKLNGSLIVPKGATVKICSNPTGRAWLKEITHTKVKDAIFANPPSLHDIKQGGKTGDCFLLGPLVAILALPEGEEIIRSMLKEVGDRVIVRLFDDYNIPHYLSIEKSIPTSFGVLSSGPLWVRLIEKAYTIFHGGKYSVLDHGRSEQAMKTLTGAHDHAEYEGYCSLPFQTKKRLSELKKYIDAHGIYLFNELMRMNSKTPRSIRENATQQVFAGNASLLGEWQYWLESGNKIQAWTSILENNHPIHLHHVEKFFSSYESNQAVQCVTTWINQNRILSGPPLSGIYSHEELELFSAIEKRLKANMPIMMSTGDVFKEGLLPVHVYAVIGVEDNLLTQRKYLLVRNPYGDDRGLLSKLMTKGGRTSIDIQNQDKSWGVKIQSIDQSTARMELSDFCSCFDYIDAFTSVSMMEINNRIESHFQSINRDDSSLLRRN